MTGSKKIAYSGQRIADRASSPRGFALLVAIVLSAVAASITLALTTLAYKSLLLSSGAQESQFAFYAADAALECALYEDKGVRDKFSGEDDTSIDCGGGVDADVTYAGGTNPAKYESEWFPINPRPGYNCASSASQCRCAHVTVFKYPSGAAKLYADGVNTNCTTRLSDPRAIERTIKAEY